MEIRLKNFIKKKEIVALVHFTGSFNDLNSNKKIFYVLNTSYLKNGTVRKYLKQRIVDFSLEAFQKACKMVLLSVDVINKNMKDLSRTELKKLYFVTALLLQSEVIVFDHFEEGFYGKDQLYYQRLFQKLITYGKSIICITDNISFLFGMVSKFILFMEDDYVWIEDFYDERIYQYVDKPPIVSYVNYLNHRNIPMEHYIETKEVLKAIYRNVSSGDKK